MHESIQTRSPGSCQPVSNLFPTLPEGIKGDVYKRMRELIEEEKAYCDRGNYRHMAQILSSVAIYEVLQQHGASEEDAYQTVSKEMWQFLDPSGMQKLARRRFFLPLMRIIVPFGFKHGTGYARGKSDSRMQGVERENGNV